MILNVKPSNKLKGSIQLPASKSYSIRAYIIAACGGVSTINHPSNCDDALVAKQVARELGCTFKKVGVNKYKITAPRNRKKLRTIHVRESGTVLRFVLPLLSLAGGPTKITGEGTLRGRPNHHLTKTLRKMGMKINGKDRQESIPIHIKGGELKAGKVSIDGSISSQFISALLITCPQMQEDTVLNLTGKLVSTDYIIMTQQILNLTGVRIKAKSNRVYPIKGNKDFKGIKNFTIPSDYGLAAFLLAAAALIESNLTLKGSLEGKYIQADGHIVPLLRKMGVRFSKTNKSLKIKGPFNLKGGSFSLKSCPDLLPIMAVLALFAKGKTRFYDIGHARVKESDRITDLRHELQKVGAKISEKKNEITIFPQETYKQNCLLDPHHDHRLAMAFSVLGAKIGCRVRDIECMSKSYPQFVHDFKAIGARVSKQKS